MTCRYHLPLDVAFCEGIRSLTFLTVAVAVFSVAVAAAAAIAVVVVDVAVVAIVIVAVIVIVVAVVQGRCGRSHGRAAYESTMKTRR